MKTRSKSYGFYTIHVSTPTGRLLHTNNERAFFLSQLQDLLSPRQLFNDVPVYKQLASCIDLLAFSVGSESIRVVLFSIDKQIAIKFIDYVLSRLHQYRSEYQLISAAPKIDIRIHCKKLDGPHHALEQSLALHVLHQDWEFDRYSSIGFYLHDRRGDWMRIWRLSNLYNNDPAQYLQFMRAALYQTNGIEINTTKLQTHAS